MLVISVSAIGQIVVRGTLIDAETKKPIEFANIYPQRSNFGLFTDFEGKFQLKINVGDTLTFTGIGYHKHFITTIGADSDTISLGEIYLISGAYGYVTKEKKRFLSKKRKLFCELIDTYDDLKPQDLVIKCQDGEVRYKWALHKSRTLLLNYENIKNCP